MVSLKFLVSLAMAISATAAFPPGHGGPGGPSRPHDDELPGCGEVNVFMT